MAIAVFAVFVAVIVFVLKTRLQRQRNGRMKLTEHHADTLPHPYPEEKTFENPIYQVSEHLTEHRRHCHPSLSLTRPYLSPVPIPHPPPLSRLSLVTRFVPSLAQVAHSILSALAIYLNAAIGLMHVVITLANTTNIARLKMQIVDLIR